MSDAFLVLAQAKGGLTCFLLPRFTPEGRVNAIRFQRLKSKLGNRSNASSEVEFQNALAFAIGEEGEGTRVIIEMVTATRLDCIVASAALMRRRLAHAIHHAEHRTAFQKKLVDQPLMQQVLADLALDVEASVALSFRLARAFDNPGNERDNAWRRLMTPVVKYWVCKTAPPFLAEAMECLGGNGYVEDGPLARIYREVPVNSIWEGSGNIMALDILRVWRRESDLAGLLVEDLKASVASAVNPRRLRAPGGAVEERRDGRSQCPPDCRRPRRTRRRDLAAGACAGRSGGSLHRQPPRQRGAAHVRRLHGERARNRRAGVGEGGMRDGRRSLAEEILPIATSLQTVYP